MIRLCLDINVLVSDILAKRHDRRGTSAAMLVDAVRNGMSPAGPVQLITSIPIIENYSSVMQRHLGYPAQSADEKAWILEEYAIEGPMPDHPHIVVGSRYVPFEKEEQLRSAVERFSTSGDAYWLRLGVVPDASFVAAHPDEFRQQQPVMRP